jgi:hypothetical protein
MQLSNPTTPYASIMPKNSRHIRLFISNALPDSPTELGAFACLREALPKRVHRMANRRARTACAVFFLIVISSLFCYSADVLFIRSAGSASSEQRELELATQFYGVNLNVVSASDDNAASALRAARQNTTLAVAIEANAMAFVNQEALLRALHRAPQGSVPLLVLGVTSEIGPSVLSTWSGGAAVGAQRLEDEIGLRYVVGRVAGLTQQLTGLEIPFPGNKTFYFALAGDHKAQEILAVQNDRQNVPVFIEADLGKQKVFLLCKTRPEGDSVVEGSAGSTQAAFGEIAPVMMFIKYGAGEHGWHALHHYANLTIDDPWLREPYGDLSYEGLLTEMETHDFHTTIAFIPWNYDRNEAQTIALVRSHPERFSICIHGNDHDHKEFEDLGSKPLNIQIGDLKQSLARMEKFQTLTDIPYDSVFVFPHSIGTESILKELKTYNFLATINSTNVPMDRKPPSALLFALRPVTLSFADFPSISRYAASMPNPNSLLGINEFLDNPILFYTHHDFFAAGIGAFDGMADAVNKIEPDTRWRSAGDIVKHLYLIRLRDDSNYDVLAFSNNVELENTSEHDLVFDVKRPEFGSLPIASVSVDGRDYPFELRGGELSLSVPVRARATRNLVIQYKNDLDLRSISTSNDSLRIYLLRRVSDYRDITVSKYYVGRALTHYYYKHGVTPLLMVVCGGTLLLLSMGGGWCLSVILKRKNPVARNADVVPNDKVARAAGQG